MQVGEEVGDDGRLGDDLVLEGAVGVSDRWYKASLLIKLNREEIGGGVSVAKNSRDFRLFVALTAAGMADTYRIDVQVPLLSRLAQIDNHLFVGHFELFQDDVHSGRPRADVVGVQRNTGLYVAGGAYDHRVRRNRCSISML